ncbi:MAG: ribonuclease P protein component 4 [Candidatus Woesearchaeota archaeon]
MAGKKASFKSLQKIKAKEHIAELFKQQQENLLSDLDLAQRYTELIRKISMTFRLRLSREIKRTFCKHCYSVLTPENSRTRVQKGKIIKFCKNCKKFTRIPYK